MKIKWLGHACFLIVSDGGTRIVTDPYEVGSGIKYAPINEVADIVTVSHGHGDHSNAAAVKGKPEVLREIGVRKVKGIEFKGIAAYHDGAKGSQRGTNTIFCFAVDNVKLCHVGDLGHELTGEQVAAIGEVDVLILPVGGFFTIDASTARKVMDRLKPKITIPMHYKTAKCDYPISGVEDFLKGMSNVRRVDSSELQLTSKDLPTSNQITVLRHAL